MAQFDVRPQAERPDNFIGYSRGIDHTENTALGTLFGTVADTFQAGVAAADRLQQKNIRDQIFENVDAIQDEFGVGDATLFQEDTPERDPLPAHIARAGENLDRLQSAHEHGALKESHYWARLNSMVRQLRQQYPGYRAEIDDMVASITGARPANALRAALFDEWQAASSETDPLSKFEDYALKEGRLPVDYYTRQEQGNPYSLTELKKHVSRLERVEAERADRRAGLAEANEAGTLTTKDAERSFRTEVNQYVMTNLQDTNSLIGQQFKTLKGQVNSAFSGIQDGGVPSQVAMEKLRGAVGDLRLALSQGARQLYLNPWNDNPENSFVNAVDEKTAQSIIDDALAPVALIENALANENFGLLKATTHWLEATSNDITKDIVDKIPMVAVMQGMQQILGNDGFNLYMNMNEDLQHGLAQTLADYEHMRAITEDGANITQGMRQGEENDLPPEYYDGLIKAWTNTIDSLDTLPLEAIQKKVDYMFGPDAMEVLSTMDDASRFTYFNRVASPMVTEKMRKLRDQGDVESWNNYQQWVTRGFLVLFQGKVQQIQNTSQSLFAPGMRAIWDDANASFVLHSPVSSSSAILPVGVLAGFDQLSAQNVVNEMNGIIRTVKPIVEDNGGDVGVDIYSLLEDMGFDPENQTDFLGMLMQAIGLIKAPEPEEEDDRG